MARFDELTDEQKKDAYVQKALEQAYKFKDSDIALQACLVAVQAKDNPQAERYPLTQ